MQSLPLNQFFIFILTSTPPHSVLLPSFPGFTCLLSSLKPTVCCLSHVSAGVCSLPWASHSCSLPCPPLPHLFAIYVPEGLSWPINLERFIISCGIPSLENVAFQFRLRTRLRSQLSSGSRISPEWWWEGHQPSVTPEGLPQTLLTFLGSQLKLPKQPDQKVLSADCKIL